MTSSVNRYPFRPSTKENLVELIRSRTMFKASSLNGFNYCEAIKDIKGPVVEIAGPTPRGYRIIDNKLPSNPFITNSEQSEKLGYIDALVDARCLPLKLGSVGMLLVSCIPITPPEENQKTFTDITRAFAMNEYKIYPNRPYPKSDYRLNQRITIIEEASRVLEPNGLLVWLGGLEEDIDVAEQNGLNLVRVRNEIPRTINSGDLRVFECVFQNNDTLIA